MADLLMAGVGNPKNNPDAQYNGAQFDSKTNTFKLPDGTVIDTNDPRYDRLVQNVNNTGQVHEDLVSQPNFMQRAFNPDAANEAWRVNQQFAANPALAQQANTTQRGIIASNLRPYPQETLPFGDNTQANVTAAQQGGYSPQDVLAQRTAALESQGGLPAAQALAQQTAAERAGLYGQAALDFGLPRTEAATEATGQQLQGGRNVYGLQNLPTEALTYGLQRGNELTQAQQLQTALPYMGRSQLAGAASEAALREQAERLLPYTETQQAGEAMKGALGSQWMAPTEPFGVPINTQTGTYGNISRSPIGMLPQMQAMAAMQGGLQMPGAPQTITAPSGRSYIIPARQQQNSILPGQQAGTQGTGTQREETPEEKRQRDKATAQALKSQIQRPTRATVAGDMLKNWLYNATVRYDPMARAAQGEYTHMVKPVYDWFNSPYGQ
jgi:hypothetical protein